MKYTWGARIVAAGAALGVIASCSRSENDLAVHKPPIAVETALAASGDTVAGIAVTGLLEPKFYAEVKTQIPGLITEVYVTEWRPVKRGQRLARIDLSEQEALARRAEAGTHSARANLAEAEVGVSRSQRELNRTVQLKDAGLATQLSLDEARSEASAAAARRQAASAQLQVAEEEQRQVRARLAKGLVVSPLDGVVASREVNVGDLASDAAAGKPIFRIVDNRLLNLTVTVPSAESAQVKVGQALEFSVDSLPGNNFTGKVMFINPEVSSSERSVKVIAEVKNAPELLKGGLFAKGRIITGTRHNILHVPRSVLSSWDTTAGTAVIPVVTGETVELRNIRTGAISGDMVEVAAGLAPGEHYVTRGGFNLKRGDKIVRATPPRTGQKEHKETAR